MKIDLKDKREEEINKNNAEKRGRENNLEEETILSGSGRERRR